VRACGADSCPCSHAAAATTAAAACRARSRPCATSRPADIPAQHGFAPWMPPLPVRCPAMVRGVSSTASPVLRHVSAQVLGHAGGCCVGARGRPEGGDPSTGSTELLISTCAAAAADYPCRYSRRRLPEQCVAHPEVVPDQYRYLPGPACARAPRRTRPAADVEGSTPRGDLLRQSPDTVRD
jgi:hypothetical protein